jgi:hypothetical protein
VVNRRFGSPEPGLILILIPNLLPSPAPIDHRLITRGVLPLSSCADGAGVDPEDSIYREEAFSSEELGEDELTFRSSKGCRL